MADKSDVILGEGTVNDRFDTDQSNDGCRGEVADNADMYRMGKQQELRRDFSAITIFGFTMILIASWEAVLA